MLSVNSNPTVTATVAKPQNTVAFRGKIQNLNHLIESGVCARKHNEAPANKIISWLKELKLRISGTTTKKLREIYTPQCNDIYTKAWMESLETMAKKY